MKFAQSIILAVTLFAGSISHGSVVRQIQIKQVVVPSLLLVSFWGYTVGAYATWSQLCALQDNNCVKKNTLECLFQRINNSAQDDFVKMESKNFLEEIKASKNTFKEAIEAARFSFFKSLGASVILTGLMMYGFYKR